uniref:Uncharacterized protein n=1 Tax=Romanomermis culicivorax TaxID=13658 RepID=A0A915IA94_ROMCU
MTTPTHQIEMDAEATATSDQTLTDISGETTINTKATMDVVQPSPDIDPSIYLAQPVALPSPPMIAAVATARYIPPVRFSQQYVSDTQWDTLATTRKAYSFPLPPPRMLFLEHHWQDYPLTLRDQITEILIPATTTPPAMLQQIPWSLTAPIVAQSVPQAIVGQPPPMIQMDVQQPQQPSTSLANLDKHGQPIRKPAHYEHSIKGKTQQQEKVKYRKAHKACSMDEPHARHTLPPSTSCTEHGKMPSQHTTKGPEQQAKQKE